MFVRFEDSLFAGDACQVCIDPLCIRSVKQKRSADLAWMKSAATGEPQPPDKVHDYVEVRYEIGQTEYLCTIENMTYDEVLEAIYSAKVERTDSHLRPGAGRPNFLPKQEHTAW